jgi:glyoxylase-like metal-dependent hydrolase (beta-lactamase superfamily II)
MQEIVNRVFIETHYPGVTLGAISREHGLILVDSPFRQDDTRSWRSSLLNLGGGVARILVQMDAHIDRSMGAKAMECTILSHIEAANVFQNRPASIKAQTLDAGAEWENYNGLGSIRWGTPHITFSDHMFLHWDENLVELDYRPGIANGSIWVDLPVEKVLFLGDAVVSKQTPFLSDADLPLWIEHLKSLFSKKYQEYFFVSGRDGLITLDDVHNQIDFLSEINEKVQDLAVQKSPLDVVGKLVPDLMKKLPRLPSKQFELHEKRLTYGLQMYYAHRYLDKPSKKEVS